MAALLNRAGSLKRALEKVDLNTMQEREKISFLAELKSLQRLIDQILR